MSTRAWSGDLGVGSNLCGGCTTEAGYQWGKDGIEEVVSRTVGSVRNGSRGSARFAKGMERQAAEKRDWYGKGDYAIVTEDC